MSEPVTQAEIEDVLSSIRRLVSEDSRVASAQSGTDVQAALAAQIGQPRHASPSTRNGITKGTQPVTRLVLTPALRVPESKLVPVDQTEIDQTAVDQAPHEQAQASNSRHSDMPAVTPAEAPVDGRSADLGPNTNETSLTTAKTQFEALLAADAIEFWDDPEDRIAQGIALHDNDPGHEDLAFFNGLAASTAADAASADAPAQAIAVECPADIAPDKQNATAADTVPASPEVAQNGDAPWTNPDATLYEAASVVAPEGQTADTVVPPSRVVSQLNPKVGAVVQKLAEMEAANAARPMLWEPDGSRDTPYAGSDLETLAWEDDHPEDMGEAGDTAPEAAAEQIAEAPSHSAPQMSADAEPTGDAIAVEQPGAAVATPATDENERMTAPEVSSNETPEVETSRARNSLAETAADAVADMANSPVTDTVLETLSGDDSFLDEDSLRELVSEIVREELQGALGERITRNVRKLVRREIHRALSARDLL
ncbi:hypothetical protein [Phaeobacter porticola]|nr:hypothetical protein [Phaeobacter porticola]